jgi:hypothetical protein
VTTPSPHLPTRIRSLRSGSSPTLVFLLFAGLCLPLIVADGFAARSPGRDEAKPYAVIFGTVWGPDDHPVYGVKVKIRRATEKKVRWELYSDHNGEFAQRLPVGKADYVVSADLKGVKSPSGQPLQLVSDVPVHIENDERADVGLHLK